MIQHCPTPTELDDLELLLSGAYAPLTRFNEPGSAVTLDLPDGALEAELVDPEGLPLARVSADGSLEPLTHAQYGPFRRLHLTPAQTREQHAGATFVPVADALTESEIAEVRGLGRVVLVALMGTGTPALSPVALLRATLAAADLLDDARVVAVPLPSHGDADVDHKLGAQVVATYAGPDLVHALSDTGLVTGAGAPSSTSGGAGAPSSTSGGAGAPSATSEVYPAAIAEIVAEDRPEPEQQGLVLFFTGLSGSGKSTLARALMDLLLEQGGRSVTSLDGDVVRRHLSAGLTFSKTDRETNIRRIGWVAAEIARHGGVAVCSPIAPFAETREQVRQMVEDAGGAFFLVHVATPLEECERRDRKGLYAKARAGEIPEFTGISSPYEEPDDPAVRVDTTGRTIEDALDDVLVALDQARFLHLPRHG
ncbi:adenylyl-sulfate kinase [Nocardioides astragali]|uniref:Adenylyl-sulfate kinase n=1 Tax=Nocardioides astragali TaxID=1776736 RepID=A0ABW2N2G4_9ACTN|nr:adenylyl-sulfate kinase [Nocardioides astragali]